MFLFGKFFFFFFPLGFPAERVGGGWGRARAQIIDDVT